MAGRLNTASPEMLFVVSALSLYMGAAVAVSLFDRLDPATVAWLRVGTAALVVMVWRRPWRATWTLSNLGWAIAFGVTLAGMNLSFYLAVDSLHLGTAVAIEFLGPIAVAVVFTRSRRNAVALAIAIGGVALLSEVSADGDTRGVAFAFLAATLWAGYILLGARVARGASLDGLGVGMAAGALAIMPFGLPGAEAVVDTPWLLGAALAVGLLSNVVPYGLDQIVLRRLPPDRFALLLAMLPATATVIGLAVLGQVPSATELIGIALVIIAIAARDRTVPVAPAPATRH
ncbi:MAG: EamA family transporter [Acidimicrobiia bacterium]|nr:EamA family transporter [Acidimicrobiia bacterium]